MIDKIDVAYAVLGIEHLAGTGKLVALASVEIDIGGVAIVLQGVQVRRDAAGRFSVHAPMFRDGAGHWRSAVVLPAALRDALGAEVLAYMETSKCAA